MRNQETLWTAMCATAVLICIGTIASAESLTLLQDLGVQGQYHRCKYSDGKVYGLPKTLEICYPTIEVSKKRVESAETDGSPITNQNADQLKFNDSSAAPSDGVWWHAVKHLTCSNDTLPSQAYQHFRDNGNSVSIVKDGERIMMMIDNSTYWFFPTEAECETYAATFVDEGTIYGTVYSDSCPKMVIETPQGYVIGTWMGGWPPWAGQSVAGPLDRMGVITVFYPPHGSLTTKLFVEGVNLSKKAVDAELHRLRCH